jgi:hypothetical protein
VVGKRFRSAWLPNLGGGFVSFVIEAIIVILFVIAGVGVASVALWVF